MMMLKSLLLFALTAHAQSFDLTNVPGSRRVITGRDGAQYIQVPANKLSPEQKRDLYEEYRAHIRALIEKEPAPTNRALFEAQDPTTKRKFVGFELPSFDRMNGVTSNDESKRDQEAAVAHALMENRRLTVDTPSKDGAVLVPVCRNPQGPLAIDDPLNQRILDCYPSLMLFVKFARQRVRVLGTQTP